MTGWARLLPRVAIPWLVLCPSLLAYADCSLPPQEVTNYMSRHPGWSLVTEDDLVVDGDDSDLVLWRQGHAELCPGFAAVDLDGQGASAYALSLVRRSVTPPARKLVVTGRVGSRRLDITLEETEWAGFPFVVWRAEPGPAVEFYTGEQVNLPYDSIVYEKMEATATLYYYSDGAFRSVLTSD